jgi:hypothetical protein
MRSRPGSILHKARKKSKKFKVSRLAAECFRAASSCKIYNNAAS